MTFKKAKYIPSQNPYLKGNPLVEALPLRMNESDFWEETVNEVEPPENISELHDETIDDMASEIMNTVSPTSIFYDMYCDFLSTLKVGYRHRNPLDPDTAKWQHGIATSSFKMSRTTAPALKLTGCSGGGKSTIVETIQTTVDPVLHHYKSGPLGYDFLQIVYIKINIPGDAKIKSICTLIMKEFDKVHGTNFAKEYGKKGVTAEKCIDRLITLCVTHLVGMIIFDEIQNICLATPNAQKLLFTLFDRLSNEARVPTIKIGTSKANNLTQSEFSNLRRFGVPCELNNYKKDDDDWKLLVEYAWSYQLLPNYVELTPELEELIYSLTAGVIHCLFYLIEQAIKMGNRQGYSCFSAELLEKVYDEKFSLMKPALFALRSGKVSAFDDLMGVDLSSQKDIDKAVKKLLKIAHDEQCKGRYAKLVLKEVEPYLPDYKLTKIESELVSKLRKESALEEANIDQYDWYMGLPI